MSIRTLRIVNGKCWRCHKLTKIAMVEVFNKVEGPRKFTDNEIKFSNGKGVILKDKYSKAVGESYLANECMHCHALIGDAYLEKDYSTPSKNRTYTFESKETEYCFVCDRDPTIGEEFLIDFFNEIKIKAKYQKKLLENPITKEGGRIADFYLNKYGIYVEFLGEWDNEEGREEYINKMKEYKEAKIPCIYIYKENLGIIHYYFDKQIQLVLKEHKMYRELWKYKFFKFQESTLRNLFFLILTVVGFMSLYSSVEILTLSITTSAIGLYQIYIIITNALNIFKRNKFSLLRLLE